MVIATEVSSERLPLEQVPALASVAVGSWILAAAVLGDYAMEPDPDRKSPQQRTRGAHLPGCCQCHDHVSPMLAGKHPQDVGLTGALQWQWTSTCQQLLLCPWLPLLLVCPWLYQPTLFFCKHIIRSRVSPCIGCWRAACCVSLVPQVGGIYGGGYPGLQLARVSLPCGA